VEALPKATRGEALERLKTQESTGPAGGLNRRLLVANSQGEQGPEDEGLAERAFGRVEARRNGMRATAVERRNGSLGGGSSEGQNPKGVTGMKQGRTVRWRAKR
jgi:hypothetical protein